MNCLPLEKNASLYVFYSYFPTHCYKDNNMAALRISDVGSTGGRRIIFIKTCYEKRFDSGDVFKSGDY